MSTVLDSYMIPKAFEKVYWRGADKIGFIHPDSYAEILMGTLEILQKGEPKDMLIVWTDESGALHMRTSCATTRAIGLAHHAAADLLERLINDGEQSFTQIDRDGRIKSK